jgi:hypothetical protein
MFWLENNAVQELRRRRLHVDLRKAAGASHFPFFFGGGRGKRSSREARSGSLGATVVFWMGCLYEQGHGWLWSCAGGVAGLDMKG